MLILILGTSCLSTDISSIEDILLNIGKISREVIGLTPVRILYYHLNVRINCLCRTNDKIFRYFLHESLTERCPIPCSLKAYTVRTCTSREVEIVKDDLIKYGCGKLGHLLYLCSHLGICVADIIEYPSLGIFTFVIGKRCSDASGNYNSLRLKKVLDHKELFLIYISAVSMGLKIYLIKTYILLNELII